MSGGRPELLHGLPPILDAGVRTLILGSFPSPASLAAAQYYAHRQNQFWRLLGALLDEPLPELDYADKQRRLLRIASASGMSIASAGARARSMRRSSRHRSTIFAPARARRRNCAASASMARRRANSPAGSAQRATKRGAAFEQPGLHAGLRRQAGGLAWRGAGRGRRASWPAARAAEASSAIDRRASWAARQLQARCRRASRCPV
jgi:G:T/U-mismatch repair DNA glycosylase